MTVEQLLTLAFKGLGISGILSFILVPLVKFWLGKLYVTKEDFKTHTEANKESFNHYAKVRKEYDEDCEKRANERHRQIKERLVELGNAIQVSHNKLDAEIRKNSDRLTSQETKVQVFWNMIEQSTANLLHRDDTPQIDRLLEKLPAENLSPPERKELRHYLEEIRTNKAEPQARRMAAAVLEASITARFPNDDQ